MATRVGTYEEITLQDGTDLVLKPLTIKGLRKFMKQFEKFTAAESEEEGLDQLIECAAICIQKDAPQYWDGKVQHSTEAWEDAADMPSIYKIIEVCGGIRLNDPNLLAAVEEAVGKTST